MLGGLGLSPDEVAKIMADLLGPAKPAVVAQPAPVVVPPPPPPKPVVVVPVYVEPPPPRPIVMPPPPSKLNWLAVAASAGAGFLDGEWPAASRRMAGGG